MGPQVPARRQQRRRELLQEPEPLQEREPQEREPGRRRESHPVHGLHLIRPCRGLYHGLTTLPSTHPIESTYSTYLSVFVYLFSFSTLLGGNRE